MLAASENGPRGTRVNVSIAAITPRPTDISPPPLARRMIAKALVPRRRD